MADIVNLRRVRKRKTREQSEQQAQENRARSGRTKTERSLEKHRAGRANDLLSQHRVDSEDAS